MTTGSCGITVLIHNPELRGLKCDHDRCKRVTVRTSATINHTHLDTRMNAHGFATIIIATGSCLAAQAATYVSDFSDLSTGAPLDTVDGWQQSAPNFDSIYPRAFGTQLAVGTPAAAVGGYYDTEPPTGEGYFSAYHGLDIELHSPASFYTNFAIVDSEGFDVDGTLYGTERNPFQITLRNAANAELFSLIFDPVLGENPDPTASSTDAWNVAWSTGGVKSLPIAAIFEAAIYGFNLQFNPDGSNVGFTLTVNGTNSFSYSNSLSGLAEEQIARIEFGISAVESEATGTPQFGTNHIVFEGIAAIPEPSLGLLTGSAVLVLAMRRRRSTC